MLCVVILCAFNCASVGELHFKKATVALSTGSTPTTVAAPSRNTTTTTATTMAVGCGGVERCINDPLCAQCLVAINNTADFPHTAGDFYGNVSSNHTLYRT